MNLTETKYQGGEYDPLKDPLYMSPQMLNYFNDKLRNFEHQILHKEQDISFNMMGSPNVEVDHVDRGVIEEYNFNQFSFQEHEDLLLKEVQEALRRIERGTYGYCQETGEPIGVKRLELIPYARYCIEVQSEKERNVRR